jgi:hypothetical protein
MEKVGGGQVVAGVDIVVSILDPKYEFMQDNASIYTVG